MEKENKLNEFCSFFKEKWAIIKIYFLLKWDGLRLAFAVRMAKALQKARNKRFYVIENKAGKLIWLCNDDIDVMRKPRKVRKIVNGKLRTFKFYMLDPHVSHLDVMKQSLYYTDANLNNKDGMTPAERLEKQANWLKYMERVRMDRMFGKLTLKK